MQAKTLLVLALQAVGVFSMPPEALDRRTTSATLDQRGPEQLYKFEVGSFKRANVTWDDYAAFLQNVRWNKVRPIVARHGVSSWTETLTSPQLRAIAAGAIPPGWSVPQYDSVSTYYVRDPSIVGALTTDPDWLALEAAAAPYVDASRGTLLAGFESVEYTRKWCRR